ncbi:50S ribosomal protein L9 [Pelagibacteraceae bacterium]|nr:50S ribosomal protein L9 [Pelagibacteraceae bacterium]
MKVILTTTIKKLGKMGDKVSVKPGYARNFLFPNSMALRENTKNVEYYEKIKDEIKKNEETKLKDAKILIEKIKKIKITFNKEADEKDQLYGSISKKEIIDYLLNNDVKVKSDDILIRSQIKSIGEHKIEVSPYVDITEEISVIVNKN